MINHLSYSSISTYLYCPESWKRRYLLKEETARSPALLFGSAFHSTMEEYIRQNTDNHRIERETQGGADENNLITNWDLEWPAQLEANPVVDWGTDTPKFHYNEGIRILSVPEVQELADSLTPLADDSGLWLERKIELQIPEVPIPIVGYIDIVTDDGIPGDFKTSSKRWWAGKAEEEIQPLFYLLALHQLGMEVPDLRFRHYVIGKQKNPSVQTIELKHTWDELFWAIELIQRVWRAIEVEMFPLNPLSWKCSAKYCEFWSDCRGKRS